MNRTSRNRLMHNLITWEMTTLQAKQSVYYTASQNSNCILCVLITEKKNIWAQLKAFWLSVYSILWKIHCSVADQPSITYSSRISSRAWDFLCTTCLLLDNYKVILQVVCLPTNCWSFKRTMWHCIDCLPNEHVICLPSKKTYYLFKS